MSTNHHKPVTGETITGLSSVKTLTVPSGANAAVVQAQTKGVRFWCDGQIPTSTTGMQLPAGSELELEGLELAGFQAIEESASATLFVSYFKDGVS